VINFAICDDEPSEIQHLTSLVNTWATEHKLQVGITCYPNAEAFLFAYEENSNIDILLLDIQMGGMDGVSLAKQVRKANKTVQIIFATSYMEYIADGYDVEALHFLVKPVSGEKLHEILNRAMDKLEHTQRMLVLQSGGQSIRLPLYEIRYVEVAHNHVTVYVYAGEEFRIKRTLADLEKGLDENFFRIGRSFIVNLRYIRKISKDMVWLDNGATVPLARGLYEKLNRAVINMT